MPKYESSINIKSGLPLGGIGAGKLEILPNGALDQISFQNNWDKPLTGSTESQGLLGFHFAIIASKESSKIGRFLETQKLADYPLISKINFDGLFPFARLNFIDKKLPVDVSLEAFSSIIPHDYRNSSLPGCVFLFTIKNKTNVKRRVTLLVIGRNTIGEWSVGRFNEIRENKDLLTLTFCSKDCLPTDYMSGTFSISIPKGIGNLSYLGEWNLQTKCFNFDREHLDIRAWNYLMDDGRLPNINTKEPVQGESIQLAGALAVDVELKGRGSIEIPVIFSWYFPNHIVGHMYQNWFEDSFDVAKYFHSNRKELHKKISSWHKVIDDLNLPYWLKDALCNNLYTLVSSTWWSKDDKFAVYEAPMTCPLMGTLDVRYYSSVALCLFFPELELNEIRQFAYSQRPNGYIPHDLGFKRIDLPNDGTTFYYWKDLVPKFILMVYRDYLWTKDKVFLRQMYPVIKKALEWELSTDRDNNFLPDNEGQDQTYDLWEFYGTNSYTSSIFLASLLACEKIAKEMDDKAIQDKCKLYFFKGRESFERELWNGKFFVVSNSQKNGKNEACMLGQLNGQWYAHLLDLGYIASKEKVKRAIESIFHLNGKASKFGMVNSCLANGKIDSSSGHSKNIWPGEVFAFASLAIFEGFRDEALKVAAKTWSNFTDNIKNPWNLPDMYDSKDGHYMFGDHYMRNLSIWGILFALSKKDKKIQKAIKFIREDIKNV